MGPLVQLGALEMGCLRQLMAQRPAAQHQHGRVTAATGDGGINPAMTQRLPVAAQDICGPRLAPGGPPVQHLDFAGHGAAAEQQSEKQERGGSHA